jgi:RNase H-fold protein (predicted Holliday junction resolvase)
MTNKNRELELAIGFDPGRDKCGIARVKLPSRSPDQAQNQGQDRGQDRGQVLNTGEAFGSGITIDQMRVVESASAIADVVAQCQEYPITTIVIGDGTSSKHWRKQLEQVLPDTVALVTVNEYNSTQEARDRYWILHPSRGLSRIIPAKLRSIPCPIDDIVAVILVERWLATQSGKS